MIEKLDEQTDSGIAVSTFGMPLDIGHHISHALPYRLCVLEHSTHLSETFVHILMAGILGELAMLTIHSSILRKMCANFGSQVPKVCHAW